MKPTLLKLQQTFLVVVGVPTSGALLDMMRYDHCFPVNEEQARLISAGMDGYQTAAFVLERHGLNGSPVTSGRWSSFSFRVSEYNTVDEALRVRDDAARRAGVK